MKIQQGHIIVASALVIAAALFLFVRSKRRASFAVVKPDSVLATFPNGQPPGRQPKPSVGK